MLNELQIVLLIFASVVLIGLYFFSRSRKKNLPKNSAESREAESSPQKSPNNAQRSRDKTPRNDDSFAEQSPAAQKIDLKANSEKFVYTAEPKIDHIKAKEALNNLGSEHAPVSEQTHARITAESQSELVKNNAAMKSSQQELAIENSMPLTEALNDASLSDEERFNQNQGVLSFGEEFDLPDEVLTKPENQAAARDSGASNDDSVSYTSMRSLHNQPATGKHHVLVVDDPGLNGDIEAVSSVADEIKPSFGIPPEQRSRKPVSATNKAPENFIIMILSTGKEFSMVDVNAALRGVGLSLSDKSIFVKKDSQGNPIIRVANMLEPGTFPSEDLDAYKTPGVVMILELPTTVRAPAAMDDLILMSRKISQRLGGRLYDMDRHLIRESDIQTMRDTALDYESEPLK